MIDSMNSVLQRINDIQKRFKVGKYNNEQNSKSSFDTVLNNNIEEQKSSKPGNTNYSKETINKKANEYAISNGLPPSLVNAVIKVESNYNPKAVSPKGAIGLMQLMPAVYKGLGIENPFDVDENIKGGVSVLKGLVDKYDWDLKKALAAYNAGEKAVDENDGIPPYKETGDYVKKVLNAYINNIE